MRLSDFNYNLPPELIAQHPLPDRSSSRLLVLNQNSNQETILEDRQFTDLLELLKPNDLLIFNDTKVIPARLFGKKESGGAVEVLLERIIDTNKAIVQIRASKSPKPGNQILIGNDANGFSIEVLGRPDTNSPFYEVKFPKACIPLLEKYGQLPLPPYITHQADADDQQRYQTVVAKNPGAVAAPTAGLHFDEQLLEKIRAIGAQYATITLHVGAGTFTPVRTENLSEHKMHSEWFSIPKDTQTAIEETKRHGGRVIAVGTTSLRALESSAALGITEGETRLFITPGYEFKVIDNLITNFHLPCSTLLMLVSAFAGVDPIRKAYDHAISQQYRFFSYGDAMFLTRQ
jgi:S-adenosylmethionine:tRNA ribosyltransferase-isomerase